MGFEEMNGHRARLRKKYALGGYKGFLDYEILELLLTFAIERRDVKIIAKDLLSNFKTLENVLKADRHDLLKVKGVGEVSSVFLNLIGDISTVIYANKIQNKDVTTITSKSDLLSYLKGNIAFNSAEQFMVIFLDAANKIIFTKVLFSGTLDRSAIYPREILKYVIKYDARSIIFAHNHPSGSLRPSGKDVELTVNMHKIFREFDISILDHIIVTKEGYFSFLENGII